jgi:hypothetical protein
MNFADLYRKIHNSTPKLRLPKESQMGYTIDDFIFWVLVAVVGGSIVVVVFKAFDWYTSLSSEVKDHKKRIERLEREFEDASGARRL